MRGSHIHNCGQKLKEYLSKKKNSLLTEAEGVLIIRSVAKSGNSGKCFQSALEYNGIILLSSPVKSLEFPRYSCACSGIPDAM